MKNISIRVLFVLTAPLLFILVILIRLTGLFIVDPLYRLSHWVVEGEDDKFHIECAIDRFLKKLDIRRFID